MFLGRTLAAAFMNKPSDVMMFVILGGCTLFFLWVMCRGSNISSEISDSDESSDTEERNEYSDESENSYNANEGSIDPGCAFVAQGYILTVLLIAIGIALVSSFQALHPGH